MLSSIDWLKDWWLPLAVAVGAVAVGSLFANKRIRQALQWVLSIRFTTRPRNLELKQLREEAGREKSRIDELEEDLKEVTWRYEGALGDLNGASRIQEAEYKRGRQEVLNELETKRKEAAAPRPRWVIDELELTGENERRYGIFNLNSLAVAEDVNVDADGKSFAFSTHAGWSGAFDIDRQFQGQRLPVHGNELVFEITWSDHNGDRQRELVSPVPPSKDVRELDRENGY